MKYKVWDVERKSFWPEQFTLIELAASHRFPSNAAQFYVIMPVEPPAPELLEALRPFAQLWRPAMADQPDSKPIYGLDDALVTVGDVRRARAALARLEGGAE